MISHVSARPIVLIAALCGALVSSPAIAQEVVHSFPELASVVKPGDTVHVTDTSGRSMTGSLSKLLPSSLEFQSTENAQRDGTTGGPTLLREGDVRSIAVDRRDSIANGLLLGLAAGGVIGLVTGAQMCEACEAPVAAGMGALFAGIGAGVGALVDRGMSQRIVVYRGPGQQTRAIHIRPLISPTAAGVQVSLSPSRRLVSSVLRGHERP